MSVAEKLATDKNEPLLDGLIRIFSFLSPSSKSKIYFSIFLMSLNALFEALSIGLFFPFLALLTNPSTSVESSFDVPTPLSFINGQTFIFYASALLACVVLSSFLRIISAWYSARSCASIGNELSVQCYKLLLSQDFETHLSRNTSDVITTLSSQINLCNGVFIYIFQICTSSFVCIAIILALFLVDFYVSLSVVFVLGSVYFLLARYSKFIIVGNSRLISTSMSNIVRVVKESFEDIKSIILDNSYNSFSSDYMQYDKNQRFRQAQNQLISVLPKFAIEGFVLSSLVLFSSYIYYNSSNSVSATFPVLGVILLGFQRLLPGLQQIFSSFAGIRSNTAPIDIVCSILDSNSVRQYPSTCEEQENKLFIKEDFLFSSLRFESVTYSYPGSSKVFGPFSFEINRGDFVGIRGKTGSGKSTLLGLITGLLTPSSGSIFVNSCLVKHTSPNFRDYFSLFAYVPQSTYLRDTSIADNLVNKGVRPDPNLLTNVLEVSNINNFVDSLPDGVNTSCGENGTSFSGGQRQRLGIARALYKQRSILILDESTSALDKTTERSILENLQTTSLVSTLVFVAHSHEAMQICSRYIDLHSGTMSSRA